MSASKSIKIGYTPPPQDRAGGETYRVISVKNNVAYAPGQNLDKFEVESLCARTAWDVTVVQLNNGASQ